MSDAPVGEHVAPTIAPDETGATEADYAPTSQLTATQLIDHVPNEVIAQAAAIIPTKGTKAIVGAIVGGITAAGSALVQDLGSKATDWTDPATYIILVVSGLVGAGLVGGGVYIPTNKAK
jgi:hypothetical protein